MDIVTYRRRRLEAHTRRPVLREICTKCLQPSFSCFCHLLKPFDPEIDFIILTHPIEVRRRIATGRMSHLSLQNSRLIPGSNYTFHPEVNNIIADPERHCVLLYPGRQSVNLTSIDRPHRRQQYFLENKRLTLFVVDGTWGTARTMVNGSLNLKVLPRVCFTPTSPSNFRVRKQPRPECYSTIEAIHHVIELLGDGSRKHDQLLEVFDKMVNRQLELAHSSDAMARSFK